MGNTIIVGRLRNVPDIKIYGKIQQAQSVGKLQILFCITLFKFRVADSVPQLGL